MGLSFLVEKCLLASVSAKNCHTVNRVCSGLLRTVCGKRMQAARVDGEYLML
jgi:hypothetical protein